VVEEKVVEVRRELMVDLTLVALEIVRLREMRARKL
jgi:hypothetical protein